MAEHSFYRKVAGSKQVHKRFTLKVMASIFAVGAWLSVGVPASVAQSNDDANVANVTKIASYTGSDRQKLLEAGAKKEGELTVYTTLPVEDMDTLAQEFEKKYGVKVKVWRAGSDKILQRTVTEARGHRYDVDVIETNGVQLEALYREDLLREVKSPYIVDLIPQAIPPHREWISTRLNIWALAYNTNLIKKQDLPKTYQDLLDPKWKGKIGIEAKDEDWFATLMGVIGEEKGIKLFRNIALTNGLSVRKGHTLLANLVASGEVPLALTVFNYKAEQLKTKGAPLDWFTINPAVARPNGMGMARHAPHPHAAVLFFDFLLSDGQKILLKRNFVPTSTKVQTKLNQMPLKFVDAKVMLDEDEKWNNLYDEIVNRQSK